jgi:hypothetical protein
MNSPHATLPDSAIEERVFALLLSRRRIMFSALAEVLPEYTWHTLLTSLNRLREQRLVELFANQWDYEIVLKKGNEPG